MIGDQELRDAARAYEKALLASLPEPKDCPAAFSPSFERKMKKLIFRVDHPVLYWLSRLLPVLLLAGLAVVCALLLSGRAAPGRPLDPPVPAADGSVVYRPTWLPDGYVPDRETRYGAEVMIVYQNDDGGQAVFLYTTDGQPWSEEDLEGGMAVLVEDCPAVLRLRQSKGDLNDLFWTDEEKGASFWISAPFREEDMIRVAESVEGQEAALVP